MMMMMGSWKKKKKEEDQEGCRVAVAVATHAVHETARGPRPDASDDDVLREENGSFRRRVARARDRRKSGDG